MKYSEAKLRRLYPKLHKLDRFIIWYDKVTGEYVDGVHFDNISLSVLHQIYNRPDDPMIGAFDITPKEADRLCTDLDVQFDFERYEYMLQSEYDYKRYGPWVGGAPYPPPSNLSQPIPFGLGLMRNCPR